jgi:hypothetical protein
LSIFLEVERAAGGTWAQASARVSRDLQKVVDAMLKWCSDNNMQLSPGKTEYVVMGRGGAPRQNDEKYEIRIDGEVVGGGPALQVSGRLGRF